MADMAADTMKLVPASMPDEFDALVGDIHHVIYRPPNPRWSFGVSGSEHTVLAFAEKGQALYTCQGRFVRVRAGDMLFFPRNETYRGESNSADPWGFYSIGFELRPRDREVSERLASLPRKIRAVNPTEVAASMAALERHSIGQGPGYLLHCRALVMALLARFITWSCMPEATIPHSERLRHVVELIHQHDCPQFGIDELAEVAELSPSRFRALFKQYTGQSVMRYQNWVRLNRAYSLLAAGHCSVTEAALATGFKDIYHFSRLFRKLMGSTPSQVKGA